MIWQLPRVRHLHDMPSILVGAMWSELVRWARAHMLAAIREHHARWRRDWDGLGAPTIALDGA